MRSLAVDNEQIELKLVSSILESFVKDPSESTETFSPYNNSDFKKNYIEPSSEFNSFYGEGGYVFEFDKDLKLKNETINSNLTEFIEKTIENNMSFLN